MSYVNPHSDYIDMRIKDLQKLNKWNTKIVNTSHADFIKDFNSCVFTNLILFIFKKKYLLKHPCSDCGQCSEQRCHGKGEERPILIRRALEKVYPDTTKTIILKDILIQFLEEHKNTKFTFKCVKCHKKENVKV